jgi:transposase
VRFHFTPTAVPGPNGGYVVVRRAKRYSSWLNQVEIWFAKIERDVIARGVFTSVADLSRKLMKYIRLYAKRARPFRWKYTDVRRRIVTK